MGFIYKQLNPHYCRTYLIAEEGSKNVVLIDPVLEHLRDYGVWNNNRSDFTYSGTH
jgi:hypothetical protein